MQDDCKGKESIKPATRCDVLVRIFKEVNVNKQDFILTELEVIGKDIEAIVREERKRLTREAIINQELAEQHKKDKTAAVGMAPIHNPNKFIPELLYLETRLSAVRAYITKGDK